MYVRTIRTVIGAVSLICTMAAPVAFAENKIDPDLVAKVEEASQLLKNGKTEDALTIAKEVVRKNRYYGDGQEMLAKAYIAKGVMADLMRAREAIGEAIRIEPKNPDFYITFADLEMALGHKQLALGRIREAVSLAPDNANARRTLIDLLEGEIEYYHNKIQSESGQQIPEESIPAIFDNNIRRHLEKNNPAFNAGGGRMNQVFENRHRFEAMLNRFAGEVEDCVNEVRYSYIQLLNFHPDDVDARNGYFKLLLRFGIIDELNDATIGFLKKRKPEADVMLYQALAQYHLGNYDRAEQAFRASFSLMTPEARRPFESIEWLLQAEERLKYLTLTESEQREKNQEFWNVTDPLLVSSTNERQLEHWMRVAQANFLYAGDKPEDAGWKSDKGLIFIKYGPPEREIRISRDVRKYASQEGETYTTSGRHESAGSVTGWTASNFSTARTIDYWLYPDYSFRFENVDGVRYSNNFSFATFDLVDFKTVLKEEEERTPQASQLGLEMEPRDLQLAYATFRGSDGKTRVETYFNVPDLRDDRTDSTDTAQALMTGVFFIDNKAGHKYGSPQLVKAKPKTTVRWPSEVFPGTYAVTAEMQHQESKRVGRHTMDLEVPAYGGGLLALSDIVLAEFADVDVKRLKVRDGIVFAPRVSGEFGPAEPVYVYYEIYHLLPGGDNMSSKYEVSYTVRLLPDTGGVFGFTRKLLGGASDQSSVSTTQQYESSEPTAYNFLDVRSIGLGIGPHELTVQVKDLHSNMVTERKAVFTIKEK